MAHCLSSDLPVIGKDLPVVLEASMIAASTAANDIGTAAERAISNEVIRLRQWGTDRICALPGPPFPDCFVGRLEACALRLTDLRASPGPRLTYMRQQWWIQDFGNECGLRQDGIPREVFALEPGVEIGVGPTTLIAESLRSIALRDFCIRLLGRKHDSGEVDQALRALRLATNRRAALVLRGKGDLVPIAYALHCRTLGADAPFVVCDRRRRSMIASVRSPANRESGVDALEAAAGGSLCMRSSRLPPDVSELLARLHAPEPERPVQLIVCSSGDNRRILLAGPVPIRVSPLRERAEELPRIVEEYAGEAIAALNAPADSFTNADLWWVIERAATSLSEIEKATLRVVARKVAANNVSQAAGLLGMAPISLDRWFKRRSQPPPPPTATIQSWARRSEEVLGTSGRKFAPVGVLRRAHHPRAPGHEKAT